MEASQYGLGIFLRRAFFSKRKVFSLSRSSGRVLLSRSFNDFIYDYLNLELRRRRESILSRCNNDQEFLPGGECPLSITTDWEIPHREKRSLRNWYKSSTGRSVLRHERVPSWTWEFFLMSIDHQTKIFSWWIII